jgi:small subunit ribosomal protein S4e
MGKSHIKRINAPKSWQIHRKTTKWVTKPMPGSQPLNRTISINTILKELLNKLSTSKEVKVILNKGLVKIDGVIRKKPNYPVCVLDVITIKDESFRLLINTKGKLFLHPIKKEDVLIKPRKIIGKKLLKGSKIQINFLDGINLLSKDKKLKVSDTVVYIDNKEKESLKFEKGALAYLLEGKQVGKMGMIKEIIPQQGTQPTKISLQFGKDVFETLKSYAIIIGKNKPVINMPNE